MFTGLIEDTGAVVGVSPRGRGLRLEIRTRLPLAEVAIGDSIACDGACLTVESREADRFVVTAGAETLRLTTLGAVRVGARLHLERARRVGDRLDGHIVQGHVDGVGTIRSNERVDESWVTWIEAPADLARYIAAKGSIAIDGVSLTVNEVDGARLRCNLVPHTIEVTHAGDWAPGGRVNLEVDVLAKYVERLLGARPSAGLTLASLEKYGFGR